MQHEPENLWILSLLRYKRTSTTSNMSVLISVAFTVWYFTSKEMWYAAIILGFVFRLRLMHAMEANHGACTVCPCFFAPGQKCTCLYWQSLLLICTSTECSLHDNPVRCWLVRSMAVLTFLKNYTWGKGMCWREVTYVTWGVILASERRTAKVVGVNW